MSPGLRLLIPTTVAAASISLAAATWLFPPRDDIGGVPGIVYWIGLTLIASALPVRLPHGTFASVSFAPIIASVVLGGPTSAAIVAAIGTTEAREVRGDVPWYGTLFNHAALMLSAVAAGVLYDAVLFATQDLTGVTASLAAFGGLLVAGAGYYILSGVLAVLAINARTGVPIRTIWARDIGAIAPNLIGLVPLGWLMAQIFTLPNGVGWWATALFVVPLFTTRLAYHRYVETRELFEQTIGALANAVDARDTYTRGHSNRVSFIAEAMCRVMKLPELEIEKIKWAGLLHDVGKIGIRDNILLKEGPLDREERVLMNQHPTIGAEIVAPARQLAPEAPLIRSHHEWINGSGYPDGIEALDIPLGARILTIADAYEAMTSSRPYRKTPLTHEQAIGELEKYSGIQFDSNIVPILIGLDREILDRKPEGPEVLPTMLNRPSAEPPQGETPSDKTDTPETDTTAAATPTPQEGNPPKRPLLASDDVS
ncbi:MAG TPA: HD-GYP domain-containing protein [Candidatus Dormibacteraeota bacterium]|nr:HD-GYP domain-containing protein [Candidatus Dormibacteraeota bacterium]